MRKLNRKRKRVEDDLVLFKQAIFQDRFDLRNFKEIRANNKNIQHTLKEMEEEYPQFAELQQDMYASLYKYVPKMTPEEQVEMEYLLNHAVVDSLMKSSRYKELRSMTRLDPINAAIGAEALGDEVKELIKQLKEEFEKALEAAKKAQEEADKAEKGEGEGAGKGKSGKGSGEANEITLEEAKKKLEEAMQNIPEKVEEMMPQIQKGMQRSLNNALRQTREVSDMIRNWGLGQDPGFQRKSYEEKVKLLNELRNSPKLKKMAELAGRLRRIAMSAQHNKVKRGTDELYDIELGGDISKIIPSEAMRLKDPTTKMLFMKDLVEGRLLSYNYQGKEKKAKGPIVCCIDESGSMEGEAEIWAKAVALALLDIARAQKRSLFVIHFSGGWRGEDLHTNSFLKTDPYSIDEMMDMATYFIGGGTVFESPLRKSQEVINEDGQFSKADIIFVTDGEAVITNAFKQEFSAWKKEKKVTVFSVMIDSGWGSSSGATLKEFSDKIENLSSIASMGDNVALSIFEDI